MLLNDIQRFIPKEKEQSVINIKELQCLNSSISEEGEEEMKNIRKRKDGRWEGRYTDINNKRKSVYAPTRAECQKLLTKIKKTNKMKLLAKEKESSVYPKRLYEFALYWYKHFKEIKNISKGSKVNYLNIINNYIQKVDIDLKKFNLAKAQEFLNDIESDRVREYGYITIKNIIKKAKQLDIIQVDFGDYLEKTRIKKSKIEWFTLEEQRKILENIPDSKYGIMIRFYLLTGCRPNELRTICKSKTKMNLTYVDGTKNENAKRWVKISNRLQEYIYNNFDEDQLFKYSLKRYQNFIKEFLNSLGIEGTIYKFRHTFASNLHYLGATDKERASYMGHSSSSITNDIYTSFDPTITKKDILELYEDWYPEFGFGTN